MLNSGKVLDLSELSGGQSGQALHRRCGRQNISGHRSDCGRDMQLSQNDSIQLSYVAIDVNGKIRGGNTDSLTMTALKPETKARIEQTGSAC